MSERTAYFCCDRCAESERTCHESGKLAHVGDEVWCEDCYLEADSGSLPAEVFISSEGPGAYMAFSDLPLFHPFKPGDRLPGGLVAVPEEPTEVMLAGVAMSKQARLIAVAMWNGMIAMLAAAKEGEG